MKKDYYAKTIEDRGFYFSLYTVPLGEWNGGLATNQLSGFDILRSSETIRDEIVEYSQSNLVDDDGFPLLGLVPQYVTCDDYPLYMI